MENVLKYITNSGISPEELDATIENTEDLNSLNALLDIKIHYLKSPTKHQKVTFDMSFIYTNDTEDVNLLCEVLQKGLLVSKKVEKTLIEITTYIKNNYNDTNYKFRIIHLLHCLIEFCSMENKIDILLLQLKPDFICAFLIQALGLQKKIKIRAYETLSCYFPILKTAEQIKVVNAVFQFFTYPNKDLNVLCGILNDISSEVLEHNDCCFTSEEFWTFIEFCISGTEPGLPKQGEYILLKCIKALKTKNPCNYLAVSEDIDNTWEAFFMLLDIGKEKQLHLVQPALDRVKYVCNLPPLWQKCIYRIYLRHSQNTLVYQIAIYLLNQSYEGNILKDILKVLLPAMNKNEYSELSCRMFETFRLFCLNLSKNDFKTLLEEILFISWNPISFWKIIQNIFVLESKTKVNIDYFRHIIFCAANLPHIYIRNECIQYLINFFWDKKSFLKMYKIVCALQKNNINYSEYCTDCEFSKEVLDFIINELINSSESDEAEKAKICILFLKNLVFEVSPTISKYSNKLSPHVKLFIWDSYFEEFEAKSEKPIIFYRQLEKFLIQYFIEHLHKDTTDSFIQLFGCLIKQDQFAPENTAKNILDAVLNPDNYNNNQIYVAFTLLRTFLLEFDKNFEKAGQTVLENWRYKIVKERDERICKEYISLDFAVNCEELFEENIYFTIQIFTSMFESQNNNVLNYIYEKTHALLELSGSKLLIDFIDICHENLKTIKKDQFFKGIVDKFIQIVYSPMYFSLDLKNISSINESLLELSEAYPIIRLSWIRAIHKLLTNDLINFHNLLRPTLGIYLQGLITTKDTRTEFNICQDFLKDGGYTEKACNPWKLCESSNPNLISSASKLLALEVLLQLAKRDTDLVINSLREKYLTFFKKRYFPGSEIHFQKLRIIQAIMLLIPYVQQTIRTTRQIVVFSYDCFLEEANQNCIKQLFDWILILLLKVQGFAVIEYIRRITSTPTPASTSAIIGLIPAVYHLTVLGDEEAFNETVRMALPWTMGAQFKLRVYAQDLIRRLFKQARQKEYKDFIFKYKHLEDCINTSIESTGTIFENTMKADLLFINDFDLFGDNSLKTIFYDIPRLNKVCPTEWEYMHFYISRPELLRDNKILYEKTPLESENTMFSDAVDEYLYKETNNTGCLETPDVATLNIQKKITPWKSVHNDVECKSDFILIASLIDKPQNLGGLSRTGEVFGIKSFVLNDVKVLKDKEFRSLSMSSESSVNAVEVKVKDLEEYILKCQADGYWVVGAEQTACSVKLNEYKFPRKTALILGNEKTGIPSKLIPLLNICLEIPQLGQVRSLNVHVAGATFIWEYAKQHLF